jgi:hypothetical protein
VKRAVKACLSSFSCVLKLVKKGQSSIKEIALREETKMAGPAGEIDRNEGKQVLGRIRPRREEEKSRKWARPVYVV